METLVRLGAGGVELTMSDAGFAGGVWRRPEIGAKFVEFPRNMEAAVSTSCCADNMGAGAGLKRAGRSP